jgi:hypothetical protein
MEDERYGRYSDPARYRPLVDAAERELERLEREFDVLRSDGPEVDSALASVSRRGRLVRLTPRVGQGAPVTIWMDDDADSDVLRYGLMVRFGRAFTQLMPDCGCDHCFEEGFEPVDYLIDDLRFCIHAVTEGGYTERLEAGGRLTVSFSIATGQAMRTQQQAELQPATDIVVPADGWGPWVPRASNRQTR